MNKFFPPIIKTAVGSRVKIIGVLSFGLLVAVIVTWASFANLAKRNRVASQVIQNQALADSRTTVQPPVATVPINRSFAFNITNEAGHELGKIDYTLDSAELRNEIVIKGQTATAVKGRRFLIINLKLKNDSKLALTLNTKDYVRLSVNGNQTDRLAPDIHNDPVEVQAISTKLGRVGFPISDTDSKLKLYLGEVNGNKTIVDLKF